MVNGGKKPTGIDAVEWAKKLRSLGRCYLTHKHGCRWDTGWIRYPNDEEL